MTRSLPGLAVMAAALPMASAAPPALTHLFPAGAQQGQTVEVAAGGTFERWPVGAWASTPAITIAAGKDRGKLSVTVAPDAVPGTHWVRVFDAEGASTLRPFLVGTLPELLEKEPNDDPGKAQAISGPAIVNGRLAQAGDVDCFAVQLKKGQTLVASLEANRTLGSPMDGVLQVVSADGFVLDQNHDCRDLDPQVVYDVPADGTYLVRVFAFPAVADSGIRFAGAETYVYRLTLTTGGFVDHPWPLAVARKQPGQVDMIGWNVPPEAARLAVSPHSEAETATVWHALLGNQAEVRLEPHPCTVEREPNSPDRPQAIVLPLTITGRVDAAGDVDVYQFEAARGQKLTFQLESRALGFPLDAILRLTDASGKQLAQVDDVGGRTGSRDPELAFTVPLDGTYRLEVRDLHGHGGRGYVYRLRALLPEPDFALTLAADRFAFQSGQPLDIPVTIDRRNGFAGTITIAAEGLPAHVTAAPVQSLATGTTAKTVILRLTAATGAASGALRIVGRAVETPEPARLARVPIAGLSGTTPHLWVSVPAPAAR